MARCLIGCGANAGEPREQLERALELLRFMPGINLLAVSRPRQTVAVGGPAGQPPFLNGACLIDTELGPHELLDLLAAVENTLHRDRSVRWGPRTIDLDLLLYGDLVIDEPEQAESAHGRRRAALTVPHPRMATRRFVLEPCAEIAPEAVHPLSGCTVRELLDNISSPHLHVAVVGVPGSGAAEVAAAIADATMARLVRHPLPLPTGADPGPWQEALAAWAHALETPPPVVEEAVAVPVETVADCWLGMLLLAAETALPAAALADFRRRFTRFAPTTTAPHVAVVAVATAEALAERLAFQARAGGHSDVFRDAGIALETRDPGATATALVTLQERLLDRLQPRDQGCDDPLAPLRPPAVVVVRADDLGRAVDEGIAAVEAVT
jgi:2-amino-4-hydroxy-6-hydroxymethyldihydropteridine diphosphokinase